MVQAWVRTVRRVIWNLLCNTFVPLYGLFPKTLLVPVPNFNNCVSRRQSTCESLQLPRHAGGFRDWRNSVRNETPKKTSVLNLGLNFCLNFPAISSRTLRRLQLLIFFFIQPKLSQKTGYLKLLPNPAFVYKKQKSIMINYSFSL